MATTVITNYQAIASTIAAMGGTSGLQFRATATHLQWKTADTEWADLVSLAEIGGTDFSLIEWGVSATHLQWRFDGVNWVDVIALSALGVTDGITSLTPEAGKIPLAGEDGKIAPEWVRDVVTATTSPGGGIGIPVGGTGLMLPATLRQQPNQSWPAARPAYDGPITLIGWSDPPAWPGGEYDQYISIPRIYVPVIEDFSTAQVGGAGEWVPRWAGLHAQPTIVADARAGAGRALRLYQGTAGSAYTNWSRSLDELDQSMRVRTIGPSSSVKNANGITLHLRNTTGLATGNRAGYGFQLRSESTRKLRIAKWVAGAYTQLATADIPGDVIKGADVKVWMEFSAVGTTLTGRLWFDGQDRAEAIVLTATDSDIASGYAGLGSNSNDYTMIVDYVSLSYDGNPAPGPQ